MSVAVVFLPKFCKQISPLDFRTRKVPSPFPGMANSRSAFLRSHSNHQLYGNRQSGKQQFSIYYKVQPAYSKRTRQHRTTLSPPPPQPLGQPPTSWIQVLGLMFDFYKCVNKNNIQLVPYLQISFESRTLVHTKHIQNYLPHFIYLFSNASLECNTQQND